MKTEFSISYQRMLAYLKGLLPNREQHQLEKEIMRHVFDEEAFEGLSSLSPEELEKDMQFLQHKISDRIEEKKKRSLMPFMRIAASVILLVGVITILSVIIKNRHEGGPEELANKTTIKSDSILTDSAGKTLQSKEITGWLGKTGGLLASHDIGTKRQVTKPAKEQYVTIATLSEAEVDADIAMQSETSVETNQDSFEISLVADLDALKNQPGATFAKTEEPAVKEITASELTRLENNVIKGTVTDINGNPLPGVSVSEKGTTNEVLTDQKGSFKFRMQDSSHALTFSYLGYVNQELTSENIIDKKIELQEDLLSLDESVVTGYGNEKKSHVRGNISTVEQENKADYFSVEVSNETLKPVPPVGSYKIFTEYVYNTIDYSQFKDMKGQYKAIVGFIVYSDGHLGDFSFSQPLDERISKELMRVIKKGGAWTPAIKDSKVTDTRVSLTFTIDTDSKQK